MIFFIKNSFYNSKHDLIWDKYIYVKLMITCFVLYSDFVKIVFFKNLNLFLFKINCFMFSDILIY